MAGPGQHPEKSGQQRELRIGDAERTAAADELAEHYAQGRLSTEEHHERLDRIWVARTPSDLAPVFSDLPGSAYQRAYQRPPAYAAADRPGVGQERPRRGQAPFPGPPFGRPAFGRPPFGRPSYAGAGASPAALGLRALPVLLKIALAIVLLVFVLANLPLILIGLVVWMVLAHHGVCRGPRRAHKHR